MRGYWLHLKHVPNKDRLSSYSVTLVTLRNDDDSSRITFSTGRLDSIRVAINDSRLESVIFTKSPNTWLTNSVRLHTKK